MEAEKLTVEQKAYLKIARNNLLKALQKQQGKSEFFDAVEELCTEIEGMV